SFFSKAGMRDSLRSNSHSGPDGTPGGGTRPTRRVFRGLADETTIWFCNVQGRGKERAFRSLVRGQNGLLSKDDLWDECCMAKKKNAAAVALGRLGGLKGGKALAKKLTAEERTQSARR